MTELNSSISSSGPELAGSNCRKIESFDEYQKVITSSISHPAVILYHNEDDDEWPEYLEEFAEEHLRQANFFTYCITKDSKVEAPEEMSNDMPLV